MKHKFENRPSYNKQIPHIFVVCAEESDYEYINTTMICAFENEDDAYEYCKNIQTTYDEIRNKAIINEYGKSHDDLRYANLSNEFESYILSTYFNNKDIDDLSNEEFDKFNDVNNNDEFKSWMINHKKIDEDIVDATIEYHNNYNDYAYYEYYYDAVPYYIGMF